MTVSLHDTFCAPLARSEHSLGMLCGEAHAETKHLRGIKGGEFSQDTTRRGHPLGLQLSLLSLGASRSASLIHIRGTYHCGTYQCL